MSALAVQNFFRILEAALWTIVHITLLKSYTDLYVCIHAVYSLSPTVYSRLHNYMYGYDTFFCYQFQLRFHGSTGYPIYQNIYCELNICPLPDFYHNSLMPKALFAESVVPVLYKYTFFLLYTATYRSPVSSKYLSIERNCSLIHFFIFAVLLLSLQSGHFCLSLANAPL